MGLWSSSLGDRHGCGFITAVRCGAGSEFTHLAITALLVTVTQALFAALWVSLVSVYGQGKQFFFEKKNQKTFANSGSRVASASLNWKKFFGSFFQKRTFFHQSISAPAAI
jgi:hypothetical protein